jgi:putative transposase
MGTLKSYRTLVLKYDLLKLPPETTEKISALLKVQEEFRRWTTEWAESGDKESPPGRNPLKYFANRFLYASRMLDWFEGVRKNGIEVKKMRPPLVFDAQLRLESERDIGKGIFVDIPKREVRIRKWSGRRGNTITLPLSEDVARWILERVQEGGKLVLATVWVGRSRRNRAAKLYIALVFRRETVPMQPKRLLVVDFNALNNGISWAVVEERRIAAKGVLRPNVSRIARMQRVVARLDSLCTEKDETCDEASATKSRIWRLLRSWEDEAAMKLLRLALQYKAAVVVDVPDDKSIRELKEGSYTSEKKVFLNFGRLRRRLRDLAAWYGVHYLEKRLYSTICPRCSTKMFVLQNRRMRCSCGFEANRDEVPAFWAAKLYPQLVSFSNSPFSACFDMLCIGSIWKRADTSHRHRPEFTRVSIQRPRPRGGGQPLHKFRRRRERR